jgi:hypothetical protein
VVRDSRHHLAPASRGQVSKQRRRDLAADVGKRVAVEEEKGSAAMALLQESYRFPEGEDLSLFRGPLFRARFLSLSIKAVLRASSCARSSIEADDKLPVPVFDKSGSGL